MTEAEPLLGGCQCGAVRYEISAKPTATAFCHCRMCQRAHGAPVVPWLVVPRSGFRLSRGETRNYASSPTCLRRFCPTCGTPLIFEDSARPDQLDIATATLDDPALAPPQRHIWTESRVPWLHLEDALPQHRHGSGSP